MEQNKNRYSKPKFTKLEIVFLILAGVFLILAIVDKVVKGSAADHFGPSDVYESENVFQSYDGQTALVPQQTITVNDKSYRLFCFDYVNDRFYPCYVSDESDFLFTYMENYKTSITYYTSNSDGGFVGSFSTDQGISALDYFIIKGLVVSRSGSSTSIPVGSKGVSYAPITEWQFSASSILYWKVGSGNSVSYYALSSSDLQFYISDDVIQLKSGVTYNLVTWDSELQDWDFVSFSPTQNFMDSIPIDYVIRLKGPRFSLNVNRDDFIDVDISYFHDDVSATPTPTSTPISFNPEFSFFAFGKPFWGQSLVPSSSSSQYYLIDVFASDIYNSLDIPIQDNTALATAMSNYGVASPWVRPAVVKSYDSTNLALYIYFTGNLYNVKIYPIGSVLPTHNMNFIRDNYSAIDWALNTEYSSSFYAGSDNGLNCISLFFEGTSSNPPLYFDITLSRYGSVEIPKRPIYNSGFSSCFSYTSNSVNNALTQGYRVGLDYSPISDITPTPDPNAPSPTPSPTPPPYVIVITDPIPTPIDWIDYQDPGYPKLKPGDLSSGFDDFEGQFSGGKGLGLLAVAFGFVPAELRSIIWLILLIAVILATIRVFLHFFG